MLERQKNLNGWTRKLSGNRERIEEDFPKCPICGHRTWLCRNGILNSNRFLREVGFENPLPKVNVLYRIDSLNGVEKFRCSKCNYEPAEHIVEIIREVGNKWLRENR